MFTKSKGNSLSMCNETKQLVVRKYVDNLDVQSIQFAKSKCRHSGKVNTHLLSLQNY